MGLACASAPAWQVAKRFGLAASTVRAIDLRFLERWAKSRNRPVVHQLGVDEIYLGKRQKFLAVVSALAPGASKQPWMSFSPRNRALCSRGRIEAASVDKWEPFNRSILRWVLDCQIVLTSSR